MLLYILSFISAIIISAIITPIIRNFCIQKKIATPSPRDRDVHTKAIPRLGGLGIAISFFVIIFAILIIAPDKLVFTAEKFLFLDKNLFGLLLAGLVWVIIGVIDDIYGINSFFKLIFQLICGLVIVLFGIKIFWFSNPLGGLNIDIGILTFIFVPLWIALLMNALNWFDGIDGLTPGISIISLSILFFLAINPHVNQPATALLCAVLAGAVAGFLPFNWFPSKIFLGDTGSMFLGLMIGAFAIISGAKLATAALVLGIPIIDAVWVVIIRLTQKKSIFAADKNHLHHRFLRAGFTQKQIVIFIYTISIIFGIIALYSNTVGKFIALTCLIGIMILVGMVLYFKNNNLKRIK